MTYTHTYKGIVWLDLQSPTDDEISQLIKRYALHPLVGEELKVTSSLAKIDFYDEYILVVLTLPTRIKKKGGYEISDREITFVIGKTFLITSRKEAIEQLEYFSKVSETNSILNKNERMEHAGHLFYYMVKRIYAGMIEDLENIKDSITSAETRIFKGEEKKMVEVLSDLSRELIDIKQTARMHHDVWEEMVIYADKNFFGKDFNTYIRDVRDEFNIIHELLVNTRELLAELHSTNDSLLNSKQNETIKMLTFISLFFFLSTFISSIFAIPARGVPIIGSSNGWLVFVILNVSITGGFLWFIKSKKWI